MAFYLVFVNISFLTGKEFSNTYYLLSLNFIVIIVLIVGIVSNIIIQHRFTSFTKEIDRQRLMINDYSMESSLFLAIVDMMEMFGKDVSIDETLERISDNIYNFFRKEIVIIQLLGHKFFQSIKGGHLELLQETFEEIATKQYPILINDVSSFPQYRFLHEKGINSFILAPLMSKKEGLTGIIGIFSKDAGRFSQRDLSLLRMISIPISFIIENAELLEKTKVLAITDPLTFVYNRRYFNQYLEKIIDESKQKAITISLAMCDIDNFKNYNDRNGHLMGDRVLKDIARIIHDNIKGADIVARYGGEEFVIVFLDTDKNTAFKICDNIRKKVEEFNFPGEELQPGGKLTISFGISCLPDDAQSFDGLIKKADDALYEAKRQGKNRVVIA